MAHPDYPGLQVKEDLHIQHRIWRMQRVGWVLLALFLLAGLLGLLGGAGMLNRGTVGTADGSVRVEYPRLDRYVAPTELSIRIEPSAFSGDSVELAVSRSWLDVFEMYGISPQPQQERVTGGDMQFRFAVTPGQPVDIAFFGRPHHVGPLPGSLQVGGGERLAFSTFVLP